MKEKNERLGIDLDDVLGPFTAAFVAFHNKRYKTNLTLNDFKSPSYKKALGTSGWETKSRVLEFYLSEEFQETQPFPEAVQAIKELSSMGYKMEVITSRPDIVERITKQWIAKHFPDCFETVHFVNTFMGKRGSRKKSEVCKARGITYHVDDSPEHAEDCSAEGINVFLMDKNYPWGALGPIPGVTKVSSWNEIVAHHR